MGLDDGGILTNASVSESTGNISVCITTLLLTNDALSTPDISDESSIQNLTILVSTASGTAIGKRP